MQRYHIAYRQVGKQETWNINEDGDFEDANEHLVDIIELQGPLDYLSFEWRES